MPLKTGNWQRNISPSSEKDSGFWDSWGFQMQEQLSQNTKWQFDSRKTDKLNSRHWISKSWQHHLGDLGASRLKALCGHGRWALRLN